MLNQNEEISHDKIYKIPEISLRQLIKIMCFYRSTIGRLEHTIEELVSEEEVTEVLRNYEANKVIILHAISKVQQVDFKNN